MFNKIHLNNNYLLIAITICFLFVSYELSFKNTLMAWRTNRELKSQLAASSDLSSQPGYLERKNHNLDKVIALYKADTTALRSNFISQVSLLADQENVKLSEVPVKDIANPDDKYIIQKLEFEGDYFALLRLTDKIRLTDNLGIIRAEQWKAITFDMNANQSKKLTLDVFFEIVK